SAGPRAGSGSADSTRGRSSRSSSVPYAVQSSIPSRLSERGSPSLTANRERLLDLDRSALLFELGLHLRGLCLADLLLHVLRRAVHQILGFLEAEPGQL